MRHLREDEILTTDIVIFQFSKVIMKIKSFERIFINGLNMPGSCKGIYENKSYSWYALSGPDFLILKSHPVDGLVPEFQKPVKTRSTLCIVHHT